MGITLLSVAIKKGFEAPLDQVFYFSGQALNNNIISRYLVSKMFFFAFTVLAHDLWDIL